MTAHPLPTPSDRRCPALAVAETSDRESACLEFAFDQLNPSDAAMLIKVIAKVVEIERTHGEDVALAMLDRAMANDGEGRRLH